MQNLYLDKSHVPLDISEKFFTEKRIVDKLRMAIYKNGYKEQHKLPIAKLRQRYLHKEYQTRCKTSTFLLTMPDAHPISLKLFHNDLKHENLIIFLHGGGFVLGGINEANSLCDRVVETTNSAVLSIGYRLAPEFKFPTAYNDTLFVVHDIIKNQSKYLPNIKNIFVMGESSGGNLATQMADIYRDNIAGQILLYPSVDYYSNNYQSKLKYASDYLLDKHICDWFVTMYLNNAAERRDVRISPILKEYTCTLPKTLMILATHDPLHDEAIIYAQKLAQSGTKVKIIDYSTMIHGFMSFNKFQEEHDAIYVIQQFIQSHNI